MPPTFAPSSGASSTPAPTRHFHLIWLVAIALSVGTACAARGPVIGRDGSASNVGGTISGSVRTLGDEVLSARKVTAVNVSNGEKVETSTAANGGYTMKVAQGHYRLEVELRDGEVVASAPGEVHIGNSDLDASRNFVISARR
jgi:hypothetical protein